MKSKKILLEMFENLHHHWGPQNWWPANSLLEMIIGALLTQNTNWQNVVVAIDQLKAENIIDIKKLIEIPNERLASLIKSTGYFNNKTRRLKNMLIFLDKRSQGKLENLFTEPLNSLRPALLSLEGIGPETADSILLYGGHYPVFVVDAYTVRILTRHGLITGDEKYEEIRSFIESNLPSDIKLYQEFHALIVKAGAEQCKKKPHCQSCPLENWRNIFMNQIT